jgi:tetratricopeptide (TPR) repeat protein
MAEERSFFDNLKDRRVPQLVGMYVAATWLVIELGDWATERFSLPPNLTSYVFVAMLVMLPGVVLFAWNHGAPGKDQWTAIEKVFIPGNAIVAAVVLYLASPSLVVEAATETVQIPDETGTVQEFVVARQGFHRDVVGFFWENETTDGDLDWLSYGLPAMLAFDMNRVSPILTVETPFDSFSFRNELKSRGYESLLDEPQGLRVEITRERRAAALIVGSFDTDGELLSANASVLDAESGAVLGSHTATGSDWFSVVDSISDALLDYLEVEPSDNSSDDPVEQHLTDSIEAVRYFTTGLAAIAINNDYTQGTGALQSAVEADPAFAEANSELSQAHYLNGDIESARLAVANALRNSYRLSPAASFILKANRYIFDGDYERGSRVVDMWTQVRPNSKRAFEAQARLGKIRGGEEGLAKAMAAYDRILELEPTAVDVYREKAEVEQQRGDYAAATGYLMLYLESRPESDAAHQQLARIYQSQGDLDAAQDALETAAILSDDPLGSEIGLARLEARRGLYEESETRLARRLTGELQDRQRFQVLGVQAEIATVRGQYERALGIQGELVEISKTFMPPMMRLFSIEGERASLLVQLGRFDEAISAADEIVNQLQPPYDSYTNFTYIKIHKEAGNQEAYREWASKNRAIEDQFPGPMQSFLAVQSAQIAIWDGNFAEAVSHADRANELMGQSILQTLSNNLSTSALQVSIAELYLEAGATGKAREKLESIMKVFPSYGYAKLVMARVILAEGDTEAARLLLQEALDGWADADRQYLHRIRAAELLASL